MSIPFVFAPIPEALLYDPAVPAEALRLWAAIYRQADLLGAGTLTVDRETIAARLGWSEKTLSKWAKILVQLGYLNVTRRGQGRPNIYRPLVPDPPGLEVPEPSLLDGTVRGLPSSPLDINALEKRSPDASGAQDVWLREWWKLQDPRPTQSFVAIRAVVRAALRAGWTEKTLGKAMTEVPVISTGALDLWRSRQTGKPGRRYDPGSDLMQGATDRTGESGVF